MPDNRNKNLRATGAPARQTMARNEDNKTGRKRPRVAITADRNGRREVAVCLRAWNAARSAEGLNAWPEQPDKDRKGVVRLVKDVQGFERYLDRKQVSIIDSTGRAGKFTEFSVYYFCFYLWHHSFELPGEIRDETAPKLPLNIEQIIARMYKKV